MKLPGGSDSKESACKVGDLGSIPGQKDPLEKKMTTHSNIPGWRILWTRGDQWTIVHKVTKSWMRLSD